MSGFFSIEPAVYEHFTLDASAAASLRNIILALCAGVILAALFVLYDRKIPGGFVRKLLKAGAFSEESAKSMEELQVKGKKLIGSTLRRNSLLSRLVKTTKEGKFFIKEEDKYKAEIRYEEKGNGIVGFILTAVFAFLIALLLIRFAPALLTIYDKILK